jgi:glycosyltransferase involved in cell wall biosynthesis
MPQIFCNAILLVLEVNPPCPNSVIEALASGIPIVGFDSGALRELVPEGAGIIIPYGGDPWKLEVPNVSALPEAIDKVLKRWDDFSRNARRAAEERYDIEKVSDAYLCIAQSLCSE